MTKNLSQNYSYADNSNGELIHVSSAKRGEDYFCPICGELMTPHMGKVRRWHFVHKNLGNCSYESYLHKLAKIRIQQSFQSSEHFWLSYKAKAICSRNCPFIGFSKCEDEKPVEFDLRKFYDTCEMEAPYHQYKADLLLSSSVNPQLPPVLIEIFVTHKCTEDKINDGVRIIEVKIQSEEQIDNIVANCKISGIRDDKDFHYNHSNESLNTLYNFNKVESFDPSVYFDMYDDCFDRRNTIVFWLNNKGQLQSLDCQCYEVDKILPSNVHYFVTEIATPFKEIFQEFSKRGVKIRNCFLCKFSKQNSWGDRLCVLYKKHNLPRKPSPYTAQSCPHYREDTEYLYLSNGIDKSYSDYIHKFHYHICKEIL